MKFKDIFLPPNLITLFRLLASVYLFRLFQPFQINTYLLVIIIAVIGLSDSLDGVVARRFDMVSELGIILDPFVDRTVFILLVIFLFLGIQVEFLKNSPTIIFASLLLFYRGLISVIGIQQSWQATLSSVGSLILIDEEVLSLFVYFPKHQFFLK